MKGTVSQSIKGITLSQSIYSEGESMNWGSYVSLYIKLKGQTDISVDREVTPPITFTRKPAFFSVLFSINQNYCLIFFCSEKNMPRYVAILRIDRSFE